MPGKIVTCLKYVLFFNQTLNELHMSGLESPTYDGAANMTDTYSESKAIIKRQQPVDLHVHCVIAQSMLCLCFDS